MLTYPADGGPADPEPCVRLAALSSLTHLVLGGMLKAKGNVAEVAVLLVDSEPGQLKQLLTVSDPWAQQVLVHKQQAVVLLVCC